MTFDNYLNNYVVQNKYVWPEAFNTYLESIENIEDINVSLPEIDGFDTLYSDFIKRTKYNGTKKEFEFELERSENFKQVLFYGV